MRLPAHDDVTTARKFPFGLLDERLDFPQHAAQIASTHAAEHIDDRLHVVVGDHHRSARAVEGGEVSEDLCVALAWVTGADGHRVQGREGIHRVLGRADVDEILNAVARVEPVARLHLAAAAEIEQDGVGDVFFGETQFHCLRPVDGHVQFRQVGGLLHAHVYRAVDATDFLREPRGDLAVFHLVAPDDLHVERRGQAEVERLTHDVGREEIKHRAGELAVEARAQTAGVFRRRGVAGLERDHDVRVAGTDQAAVAVTERNAGSGDADVVEDAGEFGGGDFAADDGLDFVHEPRGFLDARAAAGAQVQAELPGIHRWKEILPQLW